MPRTLCQRTNNSSKIAAAGERGENEKSIEEP